MVSIFASANICTAAIGADGRVAQQFIAIFLQFFVVTVHLAATAFCPYSIGMPQLHCGFIKISFLYRVDGPGRRNAISPTAAMLFVGCKFYSALYNAISYD
jgi:hypothetical protein